MVPSSRTRKPLVRTRAGRALALLAMVLGLAVPGPVVAQDGVEVVVNFTVAFAAPYAPEIGAVLIPSANGEALLTNGDDYVFVTSGDFDQPGQIRLDALEGLDADVAGLVSVDAGTSGNPLYWLDLFTVDDTAYGAFGLSRSGETGETITMFLGPVETFAAGLAVAQGSVVVDGAPLFDGVDPGGLQALLDGALPGLDSDDAPPADLPSAAAAPDEPDVPFAHEGMVDERSYESPHHGFALEWTDEWVFDPAFDAPVASNVNYDFDEVHLTVDSPQLVWFAFFAGEPPSGASFAEFMDGMSSSQRLALEIGPSAEVVVSRVGVNADGDDVGALVIRTTMDGYDFIVYEEYRPSDDGGAIAGLQLLMLVDDVRPGLVASEGLAFEGGPVVTLFTFDEILSVAEEGDLL